MTAARFGLGFSAWRWAAWTCAALLAALQAHLFLQGYRLTGDDVLFESVVLDGGSLHYIAETVLQQGRIGQFVLMPLLLFGSHFADYLWFRFAYVLLWYVDLLLFSIWVARIARAHLARLLLQLQAYAPVTDQPQRVTVEINGTPVTQWNVSADHATIHAVDLPSQLTISGGQLSVRLDIGQPTSPLQRHQSSDARLLGVLLTSLELQTR